MNINGKTLTAQQILALAGIKAPELPPDEAIMMAATVFDKSVWFHRGATRATRATGCAPMKEAE